VRPEMAGSIHRYDLHTPKTLKEKPNSPMGFFPLFSFETTVLREHDPEVARRVLIMGT